MGKIISICLTIIAVIYLMGKFPPVAVSVTALAIVLLFLVFGEE